ncbi:MAG TPA: cupredoxin domain-containing protein [Bacteriovoracaceae bacterium]|nr:cupredoxin domain-containing protein [Bacteriovoracaceae bacterium]
MRIVLFVIVAMFSFSSIAQTTRKVTIVNYETDGGVKQWLPGTIMAKKGEEIEITLINNVPSGVHGFHIPDFKVRTEVKKGEKKVVKFKADKEGLFEMKCHMHPAHVGGQILILP